MTAVANGRVFRVPTAVAAAAAVAGMALFALILFANRADVRVLETGADAGNGVAALIAAASCSWAATRSSGRFRRGWALLSASACAWFAGDLIWTVSRLVLSDRLPFPSAADLGFLTAVPLAMAGVIAFWVNVRGTTARLVSLVDGLIILVALAIVSWIFGLDQIVAGARRPFETAISLAYPLGDTLSLTVLILSISRVTRSQLGSMLLLLGGLGAMAVADASFAYTASTAPVEGDGAVVNVGWVPGYLMVAVAALWSGRSDWRSRRTDPTVSWQLALPSAAVWIAMASVVVKMLRGGSIDQVLVWLSVAIAVLLAASQLIAHRDALTRLVKSRESEALLTEMVAHARRGIATTDRDFRIIGANKGLETLLGESSTALVGSSIAKYIPREARPHVIQELERLMRGEIDTVAIEHPMLRPDGRTLWIGATSYAVRNARGEVDYALMYLEDLSSRHEADESARSSLTVLENLNHVRMEFIRSISHEFKTGLVGIKGFSELIRDSAQLDVEEAKDYAGGIYESADHLDQLVTEMVQLDSAELTPISLVIEPADLNQVIVREVKKLPASPATVTASLAPGLPAVNGDPSKLAEVVRTLLLDAQKYSPPGGRIDISTGVSLGEVMVNVRDDGEGVRADFDNRLFGSGDLYANNPIRKVVGTGLGLGIARRIVEMHGGHIWLERLEHGSVAHFTVPVAAAEPGAGGAAREIAAPDRVA